MSDDFLGTGDKPSPDVKVLLESLMNSDGEFMEIIWGPHTGLVQERPCTYPRRWEDTLTGKEWEGPAK